MVPDSAQGFNGLLFVTKLTDQTPSTDGPLNRASCRSTVAFVVALAVLLVVAESRWPRSVVVVIFILYVAAATLWVREQAAETTAKRRTVLRAAPLAILMALGVAAALAGVFVIDTVGQLRSVMIIAGVLAVYLGLGYLITWWRLKVKWSGPLQGGREFFRSSPGKLVAALLAMVAALALGLFLLGRASPWMYVPLLALGIVAFPAVTSVLSEHAIRYYTTQTGKKRRAGHGIAGLVVAVAATFGIWVWGTQGKELAPETLFPVVVMLVLAALIVAFASATLADIAVVLGAVALMGVTPSQDPLPPEARRLDGAVLVALGDSYMSGEGASRFIKGTDEGGGNQCRRSANAWAALESRLAPFDGLVFLACSGADTYNVRTTGLDTGAPSTDGLPADTFLPKPEGQTDEGVLAGSDEEAKTQLTQWRDTYADAIQDPALVVLSIGGNDAGFAKIGMACLAPGDCDEDFPSGLWERNLARVENRLRQTYAQVRRVFQTTPVVVTPYVDPVAEQAPCPSADLSEGDVEFLTTFLSSLNTTVETVATEYGFHFAAPMAKALAERGLQLCDDVSGERPGLNFIGLRSVNGLADQRFNPMRWHHNSLHPNERGHAALQTAFHRWLTTQQRQDGETTLTGLDSLQIPSERQPTVSALAVQEEYLKTVDDCATFEVDDSNGCASQAIAWATRQTGEFLMSRGLLVLIMMVGAWFACVTLFAARRP